MKKNSQSGFVLAETLVVTVFLMIIFSMIFRNFYPLIGEYEKRENYNDMDSLYSIYWIKKLVESPNYQINDDYRKNYFNNNKYVRFKCSDIKNDENEQIFCIYMLKALEVSGCNSKGNNCEIFITNYQIGSLPSGGGFKDFKEAVKSETLINKNEYSGTQYVDQCVYDKYPKADKVSEAEYNNQIAKCTDKGNAKVFKGYFRDYVNLLPDYTTASLNNAKYRVIAAFHHKKDNNNYYSYASIEVIKG